MSSASAWERAWCGVAVAMLCGAVWADQPGAATQPASAVTPPASPAATQPAADAGDPRPMRQRLRDVQETVHLQDVTAKDALTWWSRKTGIGLVVDWEAMEAEGVHGGRAINLTLEHVPAGQLLRILLQQISTEPVLLYETTPWYVQVMTKAQAGRRLVVRVYDVADLMHEAPHFSGPEFDLGSALGGSRGGSGGSGGGGRLFREGREDRERDASRRREDRGEDLAQLVRDTVEPEVWSENGGTATIRYYRGKLIVSAPLYVHERIGIPMLGERRDSNGAAER